MTKLKSNGPKVFYVRISSDKSDFENQIAKLQEKWGDLPVHQDLMSAKRRRPELDKLLLTLPKGSTIYSVQADRISRDTYEWMSIIGNARYKGITIETIYDGVVNDIHPILNALKGFAGEEERKAISRRVKDAIVVCRQKYNGEWGAQRRKTLGTYVPAKQEVRPVYRDNVLYLKELRAKGHSFQEIADIASEKLGEKLSKTHVYRLVTTA